MDGSFRKRKPLYPAGSVLRAVAAFLAVLSLAESAAAQTRRQPDTTTLTCKETQDLIERFGAMNLKSGPVRFDRYVASRHQCIVGQSVRTRYVPTTDSRRCPVQVCVESGLNRD